MKKAQGMPLQTIIIAILCLLVLVVLIAIFTGKIRGWSEGSGTCLSIGGTMVPSGSCNIADGDMPLGRNFREFSKGTKTDAAHKAFLQDNICCKVKNKAPVTPP